MLKSEKTKISIITPCLNCEKFIEETVASVIFNSSVVNQIVELEYIVCDGASKDKTLKIIEDIFSKADNENIHLEIMSEKDNGMYDALAKGLKKTTGDIVSYLNAGDLYAPHAFDIVTDIFKNFPVKWLTGFTVLYNEWNHMIGVWLPFRYRRNLIQCGFYDGRLPFIQQETTFWSRDLLADIDYDRLKHLNYAGDHLLWQTFAKTEELYIVSAWLGGWKIHRGQISANIKEYLKEMHSITKRPGAAEYLTYLSDRFHFLLPNDLKKRLNKKTMISFDHARQKYTLPL